MLSSRAFSGGKESRPNSTPADITANINCRAMLAVFESIGRESENSLILARLALDGDEEKLTFFHRAYVGLTGSRSAPIVNDFGVVSLCSE